MENEIIIPNYQGIFNTFVISYKRGETDGEMTGAIIVQLAQEFATYNIMLATKEVRLNNVAAEMVQKTDEISGKVISVSKAEILIKATEEYADVRKIKNDLENIEQYINSLKFLQKGILNEYSHMSGT